MMNREFLQYQVRTTSHEQHFSFCCIIWKTIEWWAYELECSTAAYDFHMHTIAIIAFAARRPLSKYYGYHI